MDRRHNSSDIHDCVTIAIELYMHPILIHRLPLQVGGSRWKCFISIWTKNLGGIGDAAVWLLKTACLERITSLDHELLDPCTAVLAVAALVELTCLATMSPNVLFEHPGSDVHPPHLVSWCKGSA